ALPALSPRREWRQPIRTRRKFIRSDNSKHTASAYNRRRKPRAHPRRRHVDLGATITAPEQDKNLGIKTYLNGALVSDIVLDTSQAAADTIDYVVTDQNGLTSTSTRTVIVEAAAAAEPPPSTEETLPPTEPTPPAPDTAATPATDLSTEAVGTGVVRGLTSTSTRTVIIETVSE
ncbi:MAG: hypothetical protein WAL40_18575, partial [Rhodoplanes sp.]